MPVGYDPTSNRLRREKIFFRIEPCRLVINFETVFSGSVFIDSEKVVLININKAVHHFVEKYNIIDNSTFL